MNLPVVNKVPITLDELSQITGGELIYRMFISPDLHCKRCDKFLYPPIIMIAGVGNFCGYCNNPNIIQAGIRNSALETILEVLPIPCRNSNRGCVSVMDFYKVDEHFQICNYRDCCCPFKFFGTCNWTGSLPELLNHSLKDHAECIIQGKGDFAKCFKIKINMTHNNCTLKLLCTENDNFILRAKCDVENATLKIILYYTSSIKKLSNFSYSVHYGIGNNVYSTPNYAVLHGTEITKDFDESKTLTIIDLTFMKQFSNSVLLNTVIKIVSQNNDKNETLDDVEQIICLICNTPLQPPTVLDLYNQNPSSSRNSPSVLCPTCKADFDTTVKYTIKRKYRKKIRYTYRKRNVSKGPRKLYTCFLELCSWRGVYSSIIGHLQVKHETIISYSDCKIVELELHEECVLCLVVFGHLFRVTYYDLEDVECVQCNVQLIGSKEDAKKFKYRVTIFDSKNEHRTYVRNEICQSITCNKDADLLNCVYIPYDILESYSGEGVYPAQFKIMKITDTNN